MQVSVSSQVYVFLFSLLGGAIISFIYDLFRIKRKAIKTGTLGMLLEDTLYWIIVTIVIFFIVYLSNDGELRGYIFIGVILGVILYLLLLSKFVIGSALIVLRLLYRVFKFIWMIISYPFRILFKILGIPTGFMKTNIRKAYKRTRTAGRNELAKAKMWRKIIRSRRKKK
ncbi:MAG: spore cortex biosynthesis protein YabQ [Bacillota bacterium]|nr:spore cortex biosynthesis protein YabQ [Bacillota bacterium]